MPHKDPEARKATRHAYYVKNKDKIRAAQKKWAAKPENRTKQLEWERKYRSRHPERIRQQSAHQRDRRYEAAAGRPRPDICDICARRPSENNWICFDHCHQRGHFRGWICRRCNTVLGHVEDDPRLLVKMIAYLQRTQTDTSPQFSLPGI